MEELWWRVGTRGDLMIDGVGNRENCSKGLLVSAHFASDHKLSLTIRAGSWVSPRLRGETNGYLCSDIV